MKPAIGFIGLGVMGRPMAENLLKAGYPLTVYDLNPEPVEEMKELGAQTGSSPAEVATATDVIITMLPDSPHVTSVVEGEKGLLSGLEPGKTYIDMSSISPSVTQRLAEQVAARGAAMLDAPVTGGDVGARKATLTIIVGGAADVLEQQRPILEAMGSKIVHVGGNGIGQTVKMINQLLVGVTAAAILEGMALGVKAGCDPETLFEVLRSGAAGSFVLEDRGNRMLDRNFEPGFIVDLQLKDLNLVMEAAKEQQLPLFVSAAATELFRMAKARGMGKRENSAVIELFEEMAQVSVRRRQSS